MISHEHAITLGGLRGIALDIKMSGGAKRCLSSGATTPAVPLLVGIGPSSFDHEVAPNFAERHYLLAYHRGTLDIAIVDASGGKHLARYVEHAVIKHAVYPVFRCVLASVIASWVRMIAADTRRCPVPRRVRSAPSRRGMAVRHDAARSDLRVLGRQGRRGLDL